MAYTNSELSPYVARPSARYTGLFGRVLAILGMVVCAVLFGLLASTANPIFVGVGAAVILGAIVFALPAWNIWLVLGLGLLVVGVVPIWAEGTASRAVWGVSALGFLLMFGAWFRAITVPGSTYGTPAFVWIALVFVAYATINTVINVTTLYEGVSAFKRYFQAIGILFAMAWFAFTADHVKRWRRFFLIVALVQLPWAVYELIALVPIREGLRFAYPGLVPIDVVAGTFGANMRSGGANAEMATFLIIVFAFLLARLRARSINLRWILLLAPFVLAPLFIGETKVVVVLLPLMVLALYRRELLARPHYAVAGILVGALLTVAAAMAYVEITKKPLERLVDETLQYNIYKGYGSFKLNRTTVLTFWAEQQSLEDPAGAVFGHGLGTSHDTTGGEITRRYPGFGISLTAASTLLWEQGVIGAALFLAILAAAWRSATRIQRVVSAPSWARADAAAIQAALPLFAFYLVYRSALVELLTFQILFWSLLGYLAWLARQFSARVPE
jgi:hypothetical protein